MMLTKSLRELEMNGLIMRKEYNSNPPKVEYSLTERGNALLPALNDLYTWGEEQMKIMDK
jgi:DNA-binding HxlR family transcriptional regulator